MRLSRKKQPGGQAGRAGQAGSQSSKPGQAGSRASQSGGATQSGQSTSPAQSAQSSPAPQPEGRKPLISGNWKMNLNHLQAIQLIQQLAYALEPDDYAQVDVSIHPPFTDLRAAQTLLDVDRIPIALGAQDCHQEDSGAFTGEVSAGMLAALDVKYVIVGHSERRQLFGETDEVVAAKLKAVLRHQMVPILAVGETMSERLEGTTQDKVASQLASVLKGLPRDQRESLVVAYEPIWAIGTGRSATPQDAEEVCAFIRAQIGQMWGEATANQVRIQYGGSVKPIGIADLMAQPNIDGALVGGASIEAADFARIVRYRFEG